MSQMMQFGIILLRPLPSTYLSCVTTTLELADQLSQQSHVTLSVTSRVRAGSENVPPLIERDVICGLEMNPQHLLLSSSDAPEFPP